MQIRKMTIDDYEQVFDLWVSNTGMGLRSLDDSREGIDSFLKRNPETCFISLDGETVTGAVLCGHDGDGDIFITPLFALIIEIKVSAQHWSFPQFLHCRRKASLGFA